MATAVSPMAPLTVLLAKPRGFCAGVVRAIDIVERAIETTGAPVYVRHEIVHNIQVVEKLKARGAVFVPEVDQIPDGAVTIFSAHGVSHAVEEAAEARGLDVIDATCPLVTKVHNQGRRYAQMGYDVVLIGHAGHAEIEGTLGQVPGRVHLISEPHEVAGLIVEDDTRIAYITQTTLSLADTREVIAALKLRFPAIIGPDFRNICYATQNRQSAVQRMAEACDLILIVGSRSSSNTNRLREVAAQCGVVAHLIEQPAALDPAWLDDVSTIGISAGASCPEDLVQGVIARLATLRDVAVTELPGPDEGVVFAMPPRLAQIAAE
jgi:4-hydroxy-3-methylbut-2-en-1-yl diphosphate reductase